VLGRRSLRTGSKTDGIDAQAVATYLWQHAADLVPLAPEDASVVLDLLVAEREAAVAEATRLRHQLPALLLLLDPQYTDHLPALTSQADLQALLAYPAPSPGRLAEHRAASVRRLAARLQLASSQAAALKTQIEARARAGFSPLSGLPGVGAYPAGAPAGILGAGARLATEAQLAASAGVAPLEASAAGHVRHRRNRGGKRQLHAIRSRSVRTQRRRHPRASLYGPPAAGGQDQAGGQPRAQALRGAGQLAPVAGVPGLAGARARRGRGLNPCPLPTP
jgi:hypothetical protein